MKFTFLLVMTLIFGWFNSASGETLHESDWTISCDLPNWTILSGEWVCGGVDGILFSGQKGKIIATPAFTGCDVCTINNVLHLGSGHLSMLGWYKDEDNYVQLTAQPQENGMVKITLSQIVNGKVAVKELGKQAMSGEFWNIISVAFDGSKFIVVVNELIATPLIQMEKEPGTSPLGTVGYAQKNAVGSFGFIGVVSGVVFPN